MTDILYSINLGLVAEFIPVYLGLIPIPLLKYLSSLRRAFFVSLSIGILLFLFVDVTAQAAQRAGSGGLGPFMFSFDLFLGLAAPFGGLALEESHER